MVECVLKVSMTAHDQALIQGEFPSGMLSKQRPDFEQESASEQHSREKKRNRQRESWRHERELAMSTE